MRKLTRFNATCKLQKLLLTSALQPYTLQHIHHQMKSGLRLTAVCTKRHFRILPGSAGGVFGPFQKFIFWLVSSIRLKPSFF